MREFPNLLQHQKQVEELAVAYKYPSQWTENATTLEGFAAEDDSAKTNEQGEPLQEPFFY